MDGTHGATKLKKQNFDPHFPFAKIRKQQNIALDFLHQSFIDEKKKFVILEAGTGVGKSAIGYCFANFMNANLLSSAYFLTTQRILQDQYVKDFGAPKGPLRSISSSSNYKCTFHKNQSCGESLRAVKTAERGSKFWKNCVLNCQYKNEKENFLNANVSVTNFPYFMAESQYAGKIKPRGFLVIDEAHNVESISREGASCELTEEDIINTIENLDRLIKNKATEEMRYRHMHQIFQGIQDYIHEIARSATKEDGSKLKVARSIS